MSWIHGVAHRVRTLLNPGTHERELREEMGFHEELDTMQQRDATRARRRFGNRTYYQEETRRMTWLGSLDVLRQDAGFAWRSIRRAPAFTVMVVVTLTLGIGVNAVTFSVLDRLYLRPPGGVVNPGELRRLWIQDYGSDLKLPVASEAMNFPMVREIARASGDSSKVAAIANVGSARLGGTRKGYPAVGLYVTANYFPVLGTKPAFGRFFAGDETRLDVVSNAVVVSHGFWRAHLGADSAILGKTIVLDTKRHVVVGVAERAFTGIDLRPIDFWLPMGANEKPSWMKTTFWDSPFMRVFHAVMRVPAGFSEAAFTQQATREVRRVTRELRPPGWADTLMNVATGAIIQARGPGQPGQELVISTRLQGVAAIVLLIACANIVNLLLARAVSRRREIAVRLALGISRARLVRLLTTETVLLALIATLAALLAAWWGGGLLRSLLLPDVAWVGSALHWRIALFTIAVALGCGLVSGIIPALQYSKPQLGSALKEGAQTGGTGGTPHRSRLRSALLVAQAALSVVLLVGAALFVRSLHNVRGLDIGFDAQQIVFGHVAFEPGQAPADLLVGATMREVGQRLRSRPGVEAVAYAGLSPMGSYSYWSFYWGADSSQSLRINPALSAVSSDFFAAAGIRVLRGKVFPDGPSAANQVVINETMADMMWPGRDAVGQCIHFVKRSNPCQTVVAVVETTRRRDIIEEPAPLYYLPTGTPIAETWGMGSTLIVRASRGLIPAVMGEMRSAIKAEFPAGEPVIRPMSEGLEPQYRPWRLGAQLFTGFGVLALIVAIVGIYSSVSYSVGQRTHEFGVRIALGARMRDVLQQVLREGLVVVATGVALGVVLAVAAGRLVSALLFGVKPSDPGAMLLAAGTLLAVALVAALVPALRAARVDPVVALRSE